MSGNLPPAFAACPMRQPRRMARLPLPARALIAVLLLLPAAVAADEYRLAPGDVLRVVVVGVPDLSLDVPIEMDGSAWLPLVGPIAVGGTTLREVRGATSDAYATMSLGRAAPPGGGLPQIIERDQVYVTVAAYRPIYVAGGIGAPREIPFRAGLTLRQLLVLASGPSPQQGARPPADIGAIDAAASALALEYAHVWRQKTFLGIDTPEDQSRIFVTESDAIDELVAVERSILEETRADIVARKQQLRDEMARLDKRVAILSRQKDNENAGLAMDEADVATISDLLKRGLAPASRLTEARRSALVTASRVLQIDATLETARGQAATLDASIAAIDSEARIAGWKDLGEALARVPQRRAELEALAVGSPAILRAGVLETTPAATVVRDGETLPPADVSPSLALMPGDIVEIGVGPRGPATDPTHKEANG